MKPAGKAKKRSKVWRWFRVIYFSFFLLGACLSGYICYDVVRGALDIPIDQADAGYLPSASDNAGPPPDPTVAPAVSNVPAVPTGAAAPVAPVAVATNPSISAGASAQPQAVVPAWDRSGRVNFLLMGVDLRPGETGAFNTDTMIVVTLDPASKTVGMLSIPRDLWVQIPGYGENRINTAFYIGVRRKYPGGGPALVKQTILNNLGIPINYYALVNFVGFRKVVDTLGGITIDVPKDIRDPTFPNDTYGYKPLYIHKGVQHMNGQQALDYARTRHGDSDFGRMKRQQQVLMAIKDAGLRIDIIPKIPALWAAKDNLAQTDLTLQDVFALVQMAQGIKSDNIQTAVIGDAETQDWTTPTGAMVLLPQRAKIHSIVAQMFKAPAAPEPSSEPGDQFKQLAGEAAHIEVSNGTRVEGLGGRVADWLISQGFGVVLVDSASRGDIPQTTFVESSDKPFTQALLSNIMRAPSSHSRKGSGSQANIDLQIIIGQDFDVGLLPSVQ